MYTEPSYFQIIESFVLAYVTHSPDVDVRPWEPERTRYPMVKLCFPLIMPVRSLNWVLIHFSTDLSVWTWHAEETEIGTTAASSILEQVCSEESRANYLLRRCPLEVRMECVHVCA